MSLSELTEEYSKDKLWNKKAALARLAGNETLLNRIVGMFLEQINSKQDALNDAIASKDIEAIRFTSHAMKGVSGDVGADLVREQAAFIEQKAKQGDIDNATEDNKKLAELIDETTSLMRAETNIG
ncbi:Hpt domain-containing protein [Alteromonas sp. S167]|uniref:Hpt domain-containing protein n=1 Tax=Alteromonas sp. S167 TaxID=3117402 RepID=UPI002FE10CFF